MLLFFYSMSLLIFHAHITTCSPLILYLLWLFRIKIMFEDIYVLHKIILFSMFLYKFKSVCFLNHIKGECFVAFLYCLSTAIQLNGKLSTGCI